MEDYDEEGEDGSDSESEDDTAGYDEVIISYPIVSCLPSTSCSLVNDVDVYVEQIRVWRTTIKRKRMNQIQKMKTTRWNRTLCHGSEILLDVQTVFLSVHNMD